MKKKIIFFLGGSKFSGAEKRIFLTAYYLSRSNLFDVVLYMRANLFESIKSHDKFSNYDLSSLKILVDPILGETKLVNRLTLPVRYLKKMIYIIILKPNIVHFALYGSIDLWLARFSKLIGARVFFEITSPDVARSKETKKIINKGFICDSLICVSENVRNICLKLNEFSSKRILLREHPFVDVKNNSIPFQYKKNQVLFAHRLIERKNPLVALKAFSSLAKKYSHWDFMICGRGPLENQIKKDVSEFNLDNLIFNGYELNMSARLKESKIFVSLIEPDNYPSQSVLEAMEAGCALLLSRTGQSENKFLSKENVNGYAIELCEFSVENKIEAMIVSEDLERMAANSRIKFKNDFCFDKYLSETIRILGE